MSNNNYKLSALTFPWLILITAICLSETILASPSPSSGAFALIKATCPARPSQYNELSQLIRTIAGADDIDQARTLALAPTDIAINALRNARNLMPFSEDLGVAENRLNEARSRIMLASSQEQVADEFDGMMLAGLDNDRAAHVNIGSGGCDYSSGELIAIVLGLILGVIPGLILLVVLC